MNLRMWAPEMSCWFVTNSPAPTRKLRIAIIRNITPGTMNVAFGKLR